MLYDLLKSRTLAIVAILLAVVLCLFISQRGGVPLWAYLGCTLPLALNLLFCLYHQLRRGRVRGLAGWSFWLSHLALLCILAGGLASYATRSEGYARIAQGQSLRDAPASYEQWQERYWPRPDTGLELVLQEVQAAYWPDGKLKEYANLLTIRPQNGAPFVARIEVNSPLDYRGLSISVTRHHGEALFLTHATAHGASSSGIVHLPYGKKEERFAIPGTAITGVVRRTDPVASGFHISLYSAGKVVKDRAIGAGSVLVMDDSLLQVEQIIPWSGLAVVHDPWRYLVYGGFCLFLVTTLIYYWFRLREQ